MPPKRKAAAAKKESSSAKKKSKATIEAPSPSEAAPAAAPAKSPGKAKPVGSMSASEVWASDTFVTAGKMTQEGFSELLNAVGIELMTFDAIYLQYRLAPTTEAIDDPLIVCHSKQGLQSCFEFLGCRKMEEVCIAISKDSLHLFPSRRRLATWRANSDSSPIRPRSTLLFPGARETPAQDCGAAG